jgi:hypothetical protein
VALSGNGGNSFGDSLSKERNRRRDRAENGHCAYRKQKCALSPPAFSTQRGASEQYGGEGKKRDKYECCHKGSGERRSYDNGGGPIRTPVRAGGSRRGHSVEP